MMRSGSLNFDFKVETSRGRQKLFKDLKPVFKNWNATIIEYCEAWRQAKAPHSYSDVPYYYNERANLSLLAAAFWKSGWIALEEYSAEKEYRNSKPPGKGPVSKKRGTKERARGRADLLVTKGCKDGSTDVQIEAKQGWILGKPGKDKNIIPSIKKLFAAASSDAVRNGETKIRLACCFFTISFRCSEVRPDKITGEIKRHRHLFLNSKSVAHIWAWSFPPCARRFKGVESNGEKRYWPGIIVGLKQVR
jgi:hypothetical protein